MVSLLRCYGCYVGITLLVCLLPSSVSGMELPAVAKSANFLPHKLRPTLDSVPITPEFATPESAIPKAARQLITQSRNGVRGAFPEGNRQEFTIPAAKDSPSAIPVEEAEVIEVIADRQEYDQLRGTITAEGNVLMRFAQSVMTSDRLEINLNNRLAVAQNNVVLTRGEQVLRGQRFEYNLVADRGVIFAAGGEIYQPSLNQDTDFKQRINSNIAEETLSDRLINSQPLTNVTATEGIGIGLGSKGIDLGGENDTPTSSTVKRLRFEADRLDFESQNWTANHLRLTNDPFSPPELELRAKKATFQQLESTGSKLTTRDSELVLDDRLKIPLLVSAFAFDSRATRPGLFTIAFDGNERGGLYLERTWDLLERERFSWSITPQYFLQRAFVPNAFGFSEADEGGVFDSSAFGITSAIKADFSPRTNLNGNFSLAGFDLGNYEENLRGKLELQHRIGNLNNPYQLALEYNYRDRLFNGSLGFQTVKASIGGVLTSPQYALGKTGVNLNFQGSIKNINDETDRPDLLEEKRDNDQINLTRYQGAAFLNKNFSVWTGKALPSSKEGGLRYTPVPVVPYLNLFTQVSGVGSLYSNSDSQLSLEGTIGIQGQVGHFSRDWLDYTGFELSYSQNLRGDESPFLFDRLEDRQVLSVDLTQQIYGPIRFGYQTTIKLDDQDVINSDYILEYSRRTHNITFRYNPVLEIGSFSLRISDFNWEGNPQPFEDSGITSVIQGVE
jgi:lipopolysaccharide export system protein LptA